MNAVNVMERRLLKYLRPTERPVEEKVKILKCLRVTLEIPIARLAKDYGWEIVSVYHFIVDCLNEDLCKGKVTGPEGEFRLQVAEPSPVSDRRGRQTGGEQHTIHIRVFGRPGASTGRPAKRPSPA